MIYLDNSATTRTLEQAIYEASKYMSAYFFNPASAYKPAVDVEKAVNGARERLSDALSAAPKEIIYTSGGTESNNMAIYGTLKSARSKGRIISDVTEHPSVYEVFRDLHQIGYNVTLIGATQSGCIDKAQLASALRPDTQLVSIMHVNNETGAINDIEAIYSLVKTKAPGALLHVDGVQAFCKLPFGNPKCDLYSISGHKFHAPKGIGALYVRSGARISATLLGGGQEKGMRSGTTNVPGIMAMDAALSHYRSNQAELVEQMRMCKLRLYDNLKTISDVYVNGPSPEQGAPHILNMSFVGVRGEVLLHALEAEEIYVATGSACSTHKQGKNRILEAMGVTGARQEGAIRFSLSPENTLAEMDVAAEAIARKVAFLRKYKRR